MTDRTDEDRDVDLTGSLNELISVSIKPAAGQTNESLSNYLGIPADGI